MGAGTIDQATPTTSTSGGDPLSDSPSSTGTFDAGTGQSKSDVSLGEDAIAISARVSSSNKSSPGCVKIDKKAESNNPEDSDFCETCNPHLKKGLGMINLDKSW